MNMLSWLRATLKDEIAAARAATDCDWTAFGQGDDDYDPSHAEAPNIARGHGWFVSSAAPAGPDIAGELRRVDAEHIVMQQPRAVVARCEADLAELDMLDAMPHYSWDQSSAYACEKFDPDAWADPVCTCGRDAFVDRMLRVRAYGRRRWLGWREDWRP